MNENIEAIEDVKEEKEVIIPEFYRDLTPDNKHDRLWHFSHRHDPENPRKPVRTPDNLPHKEIFNWNEFFPNGNGHIELEVGSGKGAFMAEYAKKHPEINILGSEWDYTWAAFAMRKILKETTGNAVMLCGDIFYFLRDRVQDNTIDAFHMYFPDPWPKERHHKNRLLRPDFLVEVARTLKPGKRYFYWGTDHKEYNESALETFDAFPGCKIIERNSAEPTEGIMTGFEIKYRKEGRPIYRSLVEFEK